MHKLFHYIRHLSRRRRNRALALFALVNAFLLFLLYSNIFVYPNTYIGNINISGKTAAQLKTIIQKQTASAPNIQVKDRTYHYSWDQLGVVVDVQKTITDAFAPNRRLAFIPSLFSKRILPAPITFTQTFNEFIRDNTFDFSQASDAISVDPATKTVVVEENSKLYRYDSGSLQSLLTNKFGSYTAPIYPSLAKVTNETITQIADVNQKLAAIFASPIIVYLDLGGSTIAVELKEEDIREATNVVLTPDNIHVSVSINADALNRVITKRIRDLGFPIRNDIVTPNVRDDFANMVYLRFDGSPVAALTTTADGGPNTNGSLADKYIEVDISQAKMFLFKGGKLYKSYKVSTGLDYPTPTGKFEILNKVGLGYSNIYQDWLPWWMGFSYSSELNAYFGIHEQPYRLTTDGKIILASPQAIGTPSTGGCVALAPGAAREVYSFADVGTPVYIFN